MDQTRQNRSDDASEAGGSRSRSLQTGASLILTLALVPLGTLSAVQTLSVLEASKAAIDESLAAQTAKAAAPEREAIMTAFGIARSMAATIEVTGTAGEECVALSRRIASGPKPYSFVGFIDLNASSSCNNFDSIYDFSGDQDALALIAAPRPDVSYIETGAATRQSVVVVTEPVYDASERLTGLVSVSFAAENLRSEAETPSVELVTFNELGEVLTSNLSRARLAELLPEEETLATLTRDRDYLFTSETRTGERRTYSVVPIVADRAFALGIWLPSERSTAAVVILPVLMWLVTLTIMLYVLRVMVIHPVKALKSCMSAFAKTREISDTRLHARASREFHEIQQAFEDMAMHIVREEAETENTLKERELLLQELHHRVSNNLQLMSSILNMQMRKTANPQIETVLSNIQRRLSSIARFHNELYQKNFTGSLDAAPILHDVLESLIVAASEAGIEIRSETDLPALELSADRASHLALYAFEIISFAIGLMAHHETQRGTLSLSASEDEHGDATLRLRSSPAEDVPGSMSVEERLIKAFAAQLRGVSAQSLSGGAMVQTLRFPKRPYDEQVSRSY